MLRAALLCTLILVLQQPAAAQSFSYLAVGDSYTIGEKVDEQSRWPVMLADTLTKLGHPVYDPKIVAVTGWTTTELQAGIKDTNLQQNYDLVSLLIGVNNQYHGQDIEIFRKEFTELLQQAIEFAGGHPNHVLVLSNPDYGVPPVR
ncbi:MAG: GDSL-type esterase/lipase family protein [Balneolaceae bacterium]|nr:GDSL-type esterase/lipase family protein [Balneolaceae bacterium]